MLEKGDVKAAAEACEAYLEKHPGNTALLAWKSIVLQELGAREAARGLHIALFQQRQHFVGTGQAR